jgi:hypothetical protein
MSSVENRLWQRKEATPMPSTRKKPRRLGHPRNLLSLLERGRTWSDSPRLAAWMGSRILDKIIERIDNYVELFHGGPLGDTLRSVA